MLDTSAILAFDRALESLGFARDSFPLAFDRQTLRRFDVDGRMHVERCNISKANVCPYFGREIPNWQALRLDPNKIYKLYRDPVELERGAATFRNLQLLMLHTAVNADDPKTDVTVGTVGTDVAFNAPYLTASIAVWTQEAIKLIESKQQAELSCSYRYRADMTPGKTPEGVDYDGVMRDIMGNHVALVEKGRAGPDVYVSDSQPLELPNMKRRALAETILKTLNIQATDALLLAVDKDLEKAEDEKEEKADDETPEMKAAKDKAAKDSSAPVSAGPKEGEKGKSITADALPAMLAGYVTSEQAAQLAADAANQAVARVNALHKAREDVKPLVGIVAMDSAEAVYRFALEQSKVALDGVPPAAFGALVEQVKARSKAPAPGASAPKFASDSASAAAAAIPGLGRFNAA